MSGLFDEWDQELDHQISSQVSSGGLFDDWDQELGFTGDEFTYQTMESEREQAPVVAPQVASAMQSADEKGELSWGEAVTGGVTEGAKDVIRSHASAWLGTMRGYKKGVVESLREDGYGDEDIAAYLQGGELPDREVSDPVDWVRKKFQEMGVPRATNQYAEAQEKRTLENSALADPEMQRDMEFEFRKEKTGGAKGFVSDVARVAPQLGSQVVSYAAGGPLVSSLNILSNITGMDYERNLEQGVAPDKAFNAAFWDAVMQAPLEQIGTGKIVDSLRGAVGKRLRKVAEAGLTEGLTEYLQAYPEKFTQIFAETPDASALAEVDGFLDSVIDTQFQKDAMYQGAVGMVAGGGPVAVRQGAGAALGIDRVEDDKTKPGLDVHLSDIPHAFSAMGGVFGNDHYGARLDASQFPQVYDDTGYTEAEVRERTATPFPEVQDLLKMESPTVEPGEFSIKTNEPPTLENELPQGSAMALPTGGPVVIPQPTQQTGYGPIPQGQGRTSAMMPQGQAPSALPPGRAAMPMGQYSEPIAARSSQDFDIVANEGENYRPDFEMVKGGVPAVRSAMEPATVETQPVISLKANEAATSSVNDRPQPTQAQKEAGNYKMGHVRAMGLDISIENPAGSERSGKDKDGKPWSVQMQHHYGYIKGTEGKDKDHLDVFLKDGVEASDMKSKPVFVVDQINEDGSFDEHKILAGFENVE